MVPTADEAKSYIASAEKELADMYEAQARIAWVYSTYINYDTEWLQQRADAEATAAQVKLASGAARFCG